MKEYRSFEEIDRDLEILKLQTLIDKEKIKLDYNRTKGNLTPKALLKSASQAVGEKAVAVKAAVEVLVKRDPPLK